MQTKKYLSEKCLAVLADIWGRSYPDPPREAASDPVLFLRLLLDLWAFLLELGMVGKDCWTSVK